MEGNSANGKIFSPLPPISPHVEPSGSQNKTKTQGRIEPTIKAIVPKDTNTTKTAGNKQNAASDNNQKKSHNPKSVQNDQKAANGSSTNSSNTAKEGRPKLEKEKEEIEKPSVMFELGRRMGRLYSSDDLSSTSSLDDMQYIHESIEKCSENVAQKLLNLGMLELFQEIWKRFFKRAVAEEADESSSITSACLPLILSSCGIVVNMTDVSQEVCRKILQMEINVDVMNYLKNNLLYPNQNTNKKLSSTLCLIVDGLIAILYNTVQVIPEARELFREQGIVQVLRRFLTNTDENLSCLVMILLAWVINEEENFLLDSNQKIFSFLAKEIGSASCSALHRSHAGYKTVEILSAINKLAVNDKNKERVIKSGVLSSYTKLLKMTDNVAEQFLAAQGLWSLALNCADEIKKDKPCVESLQLLLKKSDNDGVRKQVIGALAALGLKSENITHQVDVSAGANDGNKNIFISYQHSSKDITLKLRDRLQDRGYDVWIDADDICGSLAEDITKGIDTSSIVLVCLSQKYYESPYCQKEIIYADENRKDIIPLTMEPRYKPHGWLSFRMADKLRIDFSRPESFEESFKTLLQRLKKNKNLDEVDKKQINEPEVNQHGSGATCEHEVKRIETVTYSASTTAGVYSWTKKDVKEWLERNNFHSLMKWFEDYDGRLLLEYQFVLERAPQLVAPSFIAANSVKDFLRLNMALREL